VHEQREWRQPGGEEAPGVCHSVWCVVPPPARRKSMARTPCPHLFSLAHVLADQLTPLDGQEVELGLCGHSSCQERLAAARRAVEQDTSRWLRAKPSQ
jgi:hypothetical protein